MSELVDNGSGPQMPIARFETEVRDRVQTVRVQGEVDASNAGVLQRELFDLPNDALGVVLDLLEAEYIDSAGIRTLYDLRHRLHRRGQLLLVVSRPGSNVRRVLELVSFFGADDPQLDDPAEAAVIIHARLAVDAAG